jgi:hypothetical protein
MGGVTIFRGGSGLLICLLWEVFRECALTSFVAGAVLPLYLCFTKLYFYAGACFFSEGGAFC